jgi:hypothetical protein
MTIATAAFKFPWSRCAIRNVDSAEPAGVPALMIVAMGSPVRRLGARTPGSGR